MKRSRSETTVGAAVSTAQSAASPVISDEAIDGFVDRVASEGARLYRDFAWRRTHDPYAVLLSEVMLQQTQVTRVERYFDRWLADFPSLEALAAAPLEAVLHAWQGLGYNRRAVALKRLAERLAAEADAVGDGRPAELPQDETALLALPGVGPATAAGVRAFAFGEPAVYLETNVRTVFLHELLADREGVSDAELRPLVERAGRTAAQRDIDARTWNYALLDYGAYLKRILPNPSRRSAHHARQSKFEGSNRQKRARLLRLVMAEPNQGLEAYAAALSAAELDDGRSELSSGEVLALLEALAADGFLEVDEGGSGVWRVR
jgi:A/G-specific adenine glycosylase